MSDEFLLNEAARNVWVLVDARGTIDVATVATATGQDQSQVVATAIEAAERGYFEIKERQREQLVPSENAPQLLREGLPEYRAATWLSGFNGPIPTGELISWAKSHNLPPNDIFKWGDARGLIVRERSKEQKTDSVSLTSINFDLNRKDDDVRAVELSIQQNRWFYLDELRECEINPDRVRELLVKRPELAKIKLRTERTLSLTEAGKRILESGSIRVVKERNTLTPEDLESGAWREIQLRPYDVTLAARDVYPAKIHPLRKIIEQTRRAFLEMGFAEVVSPMIESAFWNFDALYQPQDHPARDMQDTFYMRDPAQAPLPDDKLVEPVRRTHENGWTTGSEGWGYTWSAERSKQVVLRTHTTAATIRALAAHPNPPGKFFCVGWTYRNETISFKHLPVFHQVDGIIVDEEANLASLMGTLQEFYSKMGFGRVKFKPAFYPYTEPSVDVVVYMESRKKWLEMGGAGIFRPEVTLPLGCSYPVLAWGLGIERLAMLRFGLSDIRDLYGTNLDALQQVPLCR
jgi:phenylalanyl-tRNA synthetase alpha chain